MKVIFMGTPDFAIPSLRAVATRHDVVKVYTRPDAVSKRGSRQVPSPVAEAASSLGIPIIKVSSLATPEVKEDIECEAPDIVIVAGLGLLVPPALLDIPRYGFINVHASALPKWRGAAPIQRAILAGDEMLGVSIMRIETGLDTGGYCLMGFAVSGHKSFQQLLDELSVLGGRILLEAVDRIAADTVQWVRQDETEATYAGKIKKGELCLSPDISALVADRRVRASSHQAPSRVVVGGHPLTVVSAQRPGTDLDGDGLADVDEVDGITGGLNSDEAAAVAASTCSAPAIVSGEVAVCGHRLFLGLADGVLEVLTLRPDGKRTMDVRSWLAGHKDNTPLTWEGITS
jgi:methionyl-tRNA formyltransferase